MIVKILLILLGIISGFVAIFILGLMIHLFIYYYGMVTDRIDEYFRERQAEKEREEIERFKKNI